MITAQEAKELSIQSFHTIDYYDDDNVIDSIDRAIETAARNSECKVTFSVRKSCAKTVIAHLKEHGYKVVSKEYGICSRGLTISWGE